MNRILQLTLGMFYALAFCLSSHAANTSPVSTVIVLPTDLQQNPKIASQLRQQGINHATVYVNWADAESKEGLFDFSTHHRYLDSLVDSGLSLIVVLDFGGRVYFDSQGKIYPHLTTVPSWMRTKYPDAFMKSFTGQSTAQPDFANSDVRRYTSRFIERAVEHIHHRYAGRVLGYAIALQEEHEIKYGQNGYQWRDYSTAAQAEFSKHAGGTSLPVINYNNTIATGTPKPEPLLNTQRRFREARLKEATCFYANTIRHKGGEAIAYFAETFTSHDGIYATGIVEQLADCIDIAVIDYNFYDGYQLVPDADVLPMLANYMASVGYQKIMVGAYAERWELQKKADDIIPVIQKSISNALENAKVIGYEIGGIQRQDIPGYPSTIDAERLRSIAIPKKKNPATKDVSRIRIGILASVSNFYVWHGDRSGGTNPHRDALLESYRLLSRDPSFEVHVIGEKNLQPNDQLLKKLDAILIPHQAALPSLIKSQLTAFWDRGGALIQDMRLGEFDENGKATFDWMHDIFGIASVEWRHSNIFRLEDGSLLRLKRSRRYIGYASLKPRTGYRLLATELLEPHRGIFLRGKRTLVFGSQPQLVNDVTHKAWHTLFLQEIKKVMDTDF